MQTLRPASQVSNIGWNLSGGANYATILGDELDGTYVHANSAIGAELEVDLDAGTDPGIDTGIVVHVRCQYISGTNASVDIILKQGVTTISSGVVALGSSIGDVTYAVPEVDAAAITDFSALRIYLGANTGDVSSTSRIYDIWLVMADAEPPDPTPGSGDGCNYFGDGGSSCYPPYAPESPSGREYTRPVQTTPVAKVIDVSTSTERIYPDRWH